MDIIGVQSATHDGVMGLLPKARRRSGTYILIPSLTVFFSFSLAYSAVYGQQFLTPKNAVQTYALHGAADEEIVPDASAPAVDESSSVSVDSFSSAESVDSSSEDSVSSDDSAASEPVASESSSSADSSVSEEPQPQAVPPIPVPPSGPAVPAAAQAFGIYLTETSAGTSDVFDGVMDSLDAVRGNALVIDVKGGKVFFDADAPLAQALGLIKKRYDLPDLLRRAHERGIYVIGRFVALKDYGLAAAVPGTLVVDPKTRQTITTDFVDPENQTVLEYNRSVLCALARSGIDEINLDYIRFSTAEVGALRVFSGAEKAAKVGGFVRMARQAINDCGPSTKLGISTFAILGWDYAANLETLGQDVKAFAPYVDIISPMAYPSTFSQDAYYNPAKNPGSRSYYLVWRTLQGYKDFLGDDWKKLRPWIQGYFMTKKGMEDQMKAVSDAGLCGFTVWSANNVYDATFPAIKTWQPAEGCGGQ